MAPTALYLLLIITPLGARAAQAPAAASRRIELASPQACEAWMRDLPHHGQRRADALPAAERNRRRCRQALQEGIAVVDYAYSGGRRAVSRDRNYYHRLYAEVVLHAILRGRLSHAQFADASNHVGLRAFGHLADSQLRQMVQTTALLDGPANLKTAMLYIEAFSFHNLARADVLRALGSVGGPFAIDVLLREGLLSESDALRQAALEGLAQLGPEGGQALARFLTEEEAKLARELSETAAQRSVLSQNQPGKLQALKQNYDEQVRALEAERTQKLAEFERSRAAARERESAWRGELKKALEEFGAAGANP